MEIEFIKQLMTEFENSQVFKMKIEINDLKLELEKETTNKVAYIDTLPVQQVEKIETSQISDTEEKVTGTKVSSPLVGTFYPASSPTSKPYVQVGDQVKQGQVLCIIEAMKVMNEIKAPVDGTVTSICVKNEETVEFDTVLMIIE